MFMMIAAAVAVQAASPTDLHLICVGAGQQAGADSASAYSRDSDGNSRTTTINVPHAVAFEDQVRIDIANQSGRIRIPQTMLPAVRGGKDGWFDLYDVHETPDEFSASAKINLFNRARIRLDRLTGLLSFTVLKGQFSGRCIPFDASTQRAF